MERACQVDGGGVDVLLVQGTTWPGHEDAVPEADRDATMRLYRNLGAATFADVTTLAEQCRFKDCAHDSEPGCAVRGAVDAGDLDEAVAALERLHAERGQWPALLLVDYHLDNKVTGLEIIEALRSAAEQAIPAAIVTADHSDEVAELIREAGHTLLRKPVKPAALRALVNRVLSRRSAA